MNLLFDIGGTKMRLVRSRDDNSFDEPVVVPTPATFGEALTLLSSEAAEILGGETPGMVIGGLAGLYDDKKGELLRAPHLSDWVGKPILKNLTEAFGAKVNIHNDADLGALGEACFGAGKGFRRVAYLTISTGVGGGLIENGEIVRGQYSLEPGHQIIEGGKTLEELISGTAIEAKHGQKPAEISNPEIWSLAARHLALGLHNVILHWSPEVIVLGGSMMKSVGIPLDQVVDHLRLIHKIYPTLPEIRLGALGDQCTLYGALALQPSFR
jgi:glucokinase